MVRSVFGKVMWVGRATVFLVGLAVILAIVLGVASMAFARDGDSFLLGARNVASNISTLVRQDPGPALSLQVDSGAPLKVNSTTRVAKLNADMVDGMHASDLPPRGYARVASSGPAIVAGSSRGVLGVARTDAPGNVYCFNLSFEPKVAVASGHLNNNATVGTVVGNDVPSACNSLGTGEYTDAAAITYAANDGTSAHRADLPFGIVFM